jgi:molecular chaperone GrpE
MSNPPNGATAQASDRANERASDEALASAAADLRIAELETQLKDASERTLRAQAELENYRKRAGRELKDAERFALVPLVRDLLPVVDNLQRAIDAAPTRSEAATPTRSVSEGAIPTRSVSEGAPPSDADKALASLLEGVQMVSAQFDAVLSQHGCKRIETVGTPFDPNQHQAIAQEPSSEHPAGAVTRATQVGYKLHDRVIRPAQVFVSTGPGGA